MPPTTERREGIERQQTTQASLSVAPSPTEERLFTDWSSEDSPPERTTQQIQSARSMEPNDITSQREPTERESGIAREIRHMSESVMTNSST